MSNLLMIALFLPLVGAAWMAIAAKLGKAAARGSAAFFALATLVVTALLIARFEPGSELGAWSAPWLDAESGVDVRFSLGLDGLSLWLFGLSALLTLTAVLVSWEAIDDRPALFYGLLLLLETGMLGVFAARDIILFYVFFEFTLIPLFFLIGIWGSEERRYAAMKFFLFTLAGSVLTFLGLLTIALWHYANVPAADGAARVLTFSIPQLTADLTAHRLPESLQWFVFLALFAGFAIKVPLFPLHTWLPLAHVQAPAAGSVILAGVLLKIGAYGFLRFSVPLLPDATAACVPWMLWLSVAGILYGALVALAQDDIKRLIAYSSVSHLGYCMLGLFALNGLGTQGSVLQLINHGLSTGGLFALVGMIYERYHTRQIESLSGLARRLPLLSAFMLLFTFSSIGLPGLNGFAGEFLILTGMFQRASSTVGPWGPQFMVMAVLAVFGVVLGAWYMLWLVQRVFFGPLREAGRGHEDQPVADLRFREAAALVPLAVFVFWIGLQPRFFLQAAAPTLDSLTRAATERVDAALADRAAGDNHRLLWRRPDSKTGPLASLDLGEK